jgi:hypothetical protein
LSARERTGFHHNAALALVGLAAVAAERADHAEAQALLVRTEQLLAVTGGELTGADAALAEQVRAASASA